ncbi:MAG: PadR family transcriptional regulator [Verrucomicrobiia bacterium]
MLDQFKKGVTTLIVLNALEDGELYGYGLRREAFERTKGVFGFSEGALYPLLHSLECKEWVKASRRKVAGRWRRYYGITPRGRRALAELRREWNFLLNSMKSISTRR